MVHLGVNRFFRATVVALVALHQVTAEQYHASGLLDVRGPEFSCEKGHFLEGSLCVKIIQEKSKPFCSVGYLKDGLCVEEYPSVYTCPPQYKLRKESASAFVQKAFTQHNKFKHPVAQEPQCSRTIVEAPIPRCSIDYEFDGMSCQKVISVDPVCPSGSEQIDERTCTYYKPISSRCPEGYSPDVRNYLKPLNERKCMKVIEVFAKPVCKDGYSFTGEHCEMFKIIPPTCPKGSKEVGHNMCAYYKKAAKRCPLGFRLLFSRYTLKKNDNCERRVVAPVNYGCDVGFDHVSGRAENAPCVSRETVSPSLVCDRGVVEPESGRCVYFNDKVCPPGGCEKISTMILRQKCPPGFKGSKNCVATETAAVEYYCSEGEGVLEGEHCVSFVDKQCPGGQCTRKGLSSVEYKCPNGFSLRNAALISYSPAFGLENASAVKKNVPTCILNELSDMEKYCREGEMSFRDRCVVYVDKECPNGGDCRITYTLDPAYDCPEGYKIPVPYKRNGRTIIDPCQKTIVIPAKMSCRKGFESKFGKCMKTEGATCVCFGKSDCCYRRHLQPESVRKA